MKNSESCLNRYGYGVRHIQMMCMCLTLVALFIARGCLAVAVLAMTDNKRNDTNITIYEWDKKTQALILSSFFWGYTVMQIPAGLLSKRYGGKPIILFSLIANAVICAVLPTLVGFGGWQIVCTCRVLMGLTQACLFPATHTLLGKWLPAHERTSYSGIVYGGSQFGIILAMPISGLLAETKIGWKLIFYTVSVMMFVTAVIWALFSASTPRDHRLMTPKERVYIESGLNTVNSKGFRTPWREIFTTKGLWAIIFPHIGGNICFGLFLVDMPTFLEKGLKLSLKNSAFLSALPYIGMLFGNLASTYVSEKIYNRGYLPLVTCRKLFNSLAFVGMAIGLTVLSLIGPDNKSLAVVALVVTLTFCGFCGAGFMMSYLDLSPNYAGVLLSITNFLANFGSILIPIATSLILRNDPTDLSRWRIVFTTTAAAGLIGNAVFVTLVSSDRQDWDDPNYLDKRNVNPEEITPVM